MQAALRGAAAAAGREKPVFFSTESAPDVARMSARPDLYGNTWRSGHDAIPTWGSVLSQYDIASGLARLAHNDSGRGGFFLDCDMLQVGQGEFGNNRVEEIRSHVTMHAMLKSTLLVSTEVDRLSDDVVALLTDRELLAVHQDPLGAAARRVASEPPARPRAVFGNASDYALFAVMPCEPGNPRQRWELRGDGTLATTDEAGAAWCVGAGQWARPAEVLPCGKAPDAGACGCDVYEGCCHDVDAFQTAPTPACLAGYATPETCAARPGGVVGEGNRSLGCDLTLSCGDGGVIEAVDFADWGTPHVASVEACAFSSNGTCSSAEATLAFVRALCVGRRECRISTDAIKRRVPDPCRGVHKRLAVAAVGCAPSDARAPGSFDGDRFSFDPQLAWDNVPGAVPASREARRPPPRVSRDREKREAP